MKPVERLTAPKGMARAPFRVRPVLRLLPLLVALAWCGAAAMPVRASSPPPAAEVEGTVTSTGSASLTIQPPRGGAVTLSTGASTRVVLNGRVSTLASVAAGDTVVAVYAAKTLVAAVIRAQSPRHSMATVEGQVTAVTASTLTITPRHGAAVTLKVGATTQVFLDGALAKLAAIETGDQALSLYDATTLVAALVQAESAGGERAVVEGQVTAVGASALTITPQQGAAVTLTVGASTPVYVDGAPATLSAVAVGDTARAIYDSATLAATIVEAEAPHTQLAAVAGEVTAAGTGSLTITPQRGAAVTLEVTAATQVFLDFRVAPLSALASGDVASAVYDATTMDAVVVAAATRH